MTNIIPSNIPPFDLEFDRAFFKTSILFSRTFLIVGSKVPQTYLLRVLQKVECARQIVTFLLFVDSLKHQAFFKYQFINFLQRVVQYANSVLDFERTIAILAITFAQAYLYQLSW